MRKYTKKLQVESLEDRRLLVTHFDLLADINILPRPVAGDPVSIVEMDGVAYFRATSPTHGFELWRSDGTPEGTRLVKGILPGVTPREPNERYQLYPSNGTLYFSANDGTSGYELWKSDGTESGTVRVKDIKPGAEGVYPYQFTEVNGTVVFTTKFGELWRTDGTEMGTVRLANLTPSFGLPWNINGLTTVGESAYFTNRWFAPDLMSVYGLWRTDGTAAGTNAAIGATDYLESESLTNVNGSLFFVASGDNISLFALPPAATDPIRITGTDTDASATTPRYLVNVNGTLYFSALDSQDSRVLFVTDGTTAGTAAVLDNTGSALRDPKSIVNVAGAVYFTSSGNLWVIPSLGAEPVRLDKPLTDPPQHSEHWQELSNFTNVSGELYFHAYDQDSQFSLWKTDGTATGTVLIKDGFGTPNVKPRYAANVNGTLFFSSTYPPGPGGESVVRELWTSDGTPEGTTAVLPYAATVNASPMDLVDVSGRLFFTAQNALRAAERELWTSDGTVAGTQRLTFLPSSTELVEKKHLTNVSGTLYFVVESPSSGELWKSDGTVDGTVPIKSWSQAPSQLVNLNGALVFSLNTPTDGVALWTSDGTEDGTHVLHHFGTTGGFGPSPGFFNSDGTLYFRANDGTRGYELWKSDGTEAGTVIVRDIRQGPASAFGSGSDLIDFQPVRMGDHIYFAANDGFKGVELWKSDGTTQGTVLVADLRPGSSSYGSNPHYLTAADAYVYFRAYAGGVYALWRTDGTVEGTIRLTTQSLVDPASEFPSPDRLANVNGIVYFAQYDGVHGFELWRSDGTPEGTRMVKDLVPGAFSSSPTQLVNINGTLYFSAVDPEHGHELWRSNGTEAGTQLVWDFTSDSGSSNPSQILWWNDRLLVAATTDAFGRELWIGEDTISTWHNFQLPTDVNGDGQVSPLDALLVINELIDRIYSDAVTGRIHDSIVAPPYMFDVNNDQFIAPLDALLVINQLPSTVGRSMAPAGLLVQEDEDWWLWSTRHRNSGLEFDYTYLTEVDSMLLR